MLAPNCKEDTDFCGSCQSTCPERGSYTCEEGTEALCSMKRVCAVINEPPTCKEAMQIGDLTLVQSLEVTAEPHVGYIYYTVEEEDQVKV